MEIKKNKGAARLLFLLATAIALTGIVSGSPSAAASSAANLYLGAKKGGNLKKVPVESTQLVPLGMTAGIKLFADGVLVAGLSAFKSGGRETCPAVDAGLRMGDILVKINGEKIRNTAHLTRLIGKKDQKPVTFCIIRNGECIDLTLTPAADDSDGSVRIGAWVRDSMAGIGTLTFYDPGTGTFGALGHGINDIDTGLLMPLSSGSIMPSSVAGVRRGEIGKPGELQGVFDLDGDFGSIWENSVSGIFGTVSDKHFAEGMEAVPICPHGEVKAGPAVILANVEGREVREYAIEIVKVPGSKYSNLTICVTDPALIERTGGIVQGMSGSPILQDGRFVGAVTHVLIGDPVRGYAVFIEKMIEQTCEQETQNAA